MINSQKTEYKSTTPDTRFDIGSARTVSSTFFVYIKNNTNKTQEEQQLHSDTNNIHIIKCCQDWVR